MRATLHALVGRAILGAVLTAALGTGCRRPVPSATALGARAVRVGPQGGSLELAVAKGTLRVEIPPGALDEGIELVARELAVGPAEAVGPAFELLPHGTVFNKPVSVSFSTPKQRLEPDYPLHRLRVGTQVASGWELLPSRLGEHGEIVGQTTHFSVFALVGDCFVAGTGDDFPLAGCEGTAPRVRTSVPKRVSVEGGKVSLSITLFKEPTGGPVLVTVEGLQPGTKYYLRHDSELNLAEEVTDSAGVLSYSRSRNEHHRTVLTHVHGSLALTAAACVPPVGLWNSTTSTCALLQDVPDGDVTLHEDGFTLDCKNPSTGMHHVIGTSTTRHAFGVSVYGRSGTTITNCEIRNVDVGISLDGSLDAVVRNVGIDASPPSQGVRVMGASAGLLTQLRIRNTRTAINVQPGSNAEVSSSEISDVGYGVVLFQGDNFGVRDVTVRNASVHGFLVSNFPGADLQNVAALGLGSTASGVTFYNGTSGTIRGATTSGGGTGLHVQYDATGPVHVENSTASCANRGVVLDGPGPFLFFHNNLSGNSIAQLARFGPYPASNLWDDRPSSPTYQQGNYWGRGCPGPLLETTDIASASPGTTDAFPFGSRSAWAGGGAPGCNAVVGAAPPVILSPVENGVVQTAMPIVYGSATPGATVEVLSRTQVIAAGTVDSCGTFAVQVVAPLGQGPGVLTARESSDGVTSAASAPRTFVVEAAVPTLAPPVITAPESGAFLSTAAPVVTGTAAPGSVVEVFVDGLSTSFGTAAGSGLFSVGLAGPIADGLHRLTARAALGGLVSEVSAPVDVVIDTLAPAAPIITYPPGSLTVGDATVPVRGRAEPEASVNLYASGTPVLVTSTGPDGGFAGGLLLAPGTTSITARATDRAGNSSALSLPVSVTVTEVSSSALLVGSRGVLTISSVSDAPDPFTPSAGEQNVVRATVEIGRTKKPWKGGAGSSLVTTRDVYDVATSMLVSSVVHEQPVLASKKKSGTLTMIADATWNGTTGAGGLAPGGIYESRTSITLLEPLPPRPGQVQCGPLGKLGGRCVQDKIDQFATVQLLREGRLTPQPMPANCGQQFEACNGKDDNCNGAVDEGLACAVSATCPCQPRAQCGPGDCGRTPDGCGGVLPCGACP